MGATREATEEIAQASELDSDADFAGMVMAAVGTVLPHDGYCLFGVDPGSRLRTFMLSRHGLDGVAARLAYNEAVERDANRYADLAVASVPAGVLGGCGRRDGRSPRLHEILRPAGMHSELRLGLGTPSTWIGGVSLFRADRWRPFDDHDVQVAVDIAGALGYAVRLGQLLPAVGAWAGLTPRESQVLALAAQGLPSQRVASRLGLSLLTVNTHLRSIYRKCGVSSRDELVGRLT